jgi:hypothetical protein
LKLLVPCSPAIAPASPPTTSPPCCPSPFGKAPPPFIDQVKEAARLLLEHHDLTPNQREGFTRAIYRLLDRGVWHDKETGERLLASLAIHRPPKE